MQTGLDRLIAEPELLNNLGRIGIVTNQAIIAQNFHTAVEVISNSVSKASGAKITAIFGPQHGYYQTEQDNMIETPHGSYHLSTGEDVPLFSLYSEDRIPTREQVENIDTFVLDLMDIGCRIYTYMQTLAACMISAAQNKKRVIVLDRPNPLGLSYKKDGIWHRVEGNVLDLKLESFVGWFPIPFRHGLTLGELGKLFAQIKCLELDYQVIKVTGLTRDTPLSVLQNMPWSIPSPNMPSWLSAFFFPAFVSLEATNVSEGRGTTLPFQLIGAPFLNPEACMAFFNKIAANKSMPAFDISGVYCRRQDFRPTFNKHAGKICHGLMWHCSNPEETNLFALGIYFLAFCLRNYPQEFKWKEPGYEYNYKDPPILLILGEEEWMKLFKGFEYSGNDSLMHEQLLDALLWADKQAQEFAEDKQEIHLY